MKKKLSLLLIMLLVLTMSAVMMACGPEEEGPGPDETPAARVLDKIEITSQPTKLAYMAGETFARAGMVVTAHYTQEGGDPSSRAVTNYTTSPSAALAKTDKTITVSYTEAGVTKTNTVTITVSGVVTVTKPTGDRFVVGGETTAPEGVAYTFTITVGSGYTGTPTFTLSVGGSNVAVPTASINGKVYTYTIPATGVTGNIVIGAVTGLTPLAAQGTAIATKQQFLDSIYKADKSNLNKDYYLTADIDFGGDTLPNWLTTTQVNETGRAWDTNAYTGVFDGRGYAIKNFKLNWTGTGTADTGLFPQLGKGATTVTQADVLAGNNGVIKNLKITGVQMTAFQRAGIIAGVNFGLIENCYVEADITIEGKNAWEVGGVIAGEIGSDTNGIGLVRNNIIKSTGDAHTGAIAGYIKVGGSDNVEQINAGLAIHVYNNFIVTDDMVIKTSISSVTGVTAIGTNKLFTAAQAGSQDYSGLSTDFWTMNSGALPTLKVLA